MLQLFDETHEINSDEITYIFGNYIKYKIMEYKDLYDFNILFNEVDAVLVLLSRIVNNKQYNHWIAITRSTSNELQYYDPYGFNLLAEFSLANGDDINILLGLIRSYRGFVHINKFKHQKLKNNVLTCGFHAINRAFYYFLTNIEYNAMISQITNDFDKLVTYAHQYQLLSFRARF